MKKLCLIFAQNGSNRSTTAITVGAAGGRAASSTPPREAEQEQGSPDIASGATDDLSLGESAASAVAAVEVKEQPEREASPFSQCSSDGSCDLTVKPISKIRKTDKSIGKYHWEKVKIVFHVRKFKSVHTKRLVYTDRHSRRR